MEKIEIGPNIIYVQPQILARNLQFIYARIEYMWEYICNMFLQESVNLVRVTP